VILLDTNAVVLMNRRHRRTRVLDRHAGRLRFSPIVLLELQLLQECGRGRYRTRDPVRAAREDPRWTYDDPPLAAVVERALDLSWTRDPFDRLIAAHALCRGWRLATSDATILRHLPSSTTLDLR
jgi:predicted nucleic acid-binding protein